MPRFVPSIATALLLGLCWPAAKAATLSVTATDIKPGPGSLRVVLYRGPDGFRHEDRSYRTLSVPARTATATVKFEGLPAGRYAVIAYHDANDDKRLDLRLGMFPKEGWGLSNNPRVMGPPTFDASAVDLAEPGATTSIEMHY